MPNSGTAMSTESASAVVVDSDAVGGSNPGMTSNRLETATNKNSVPA